MNHTRTPWKLIDGYYHDATELKIVSEDNQSFLYVLVGGLGFRAEQTKANAAFVCQAVNAHSELVTALKNAVNSLEWAAMIISDIPVKSTFRENLELAHKAIAKAEGTL